MPGGTFARAAIVLTSGISVLGCSTSPRDSAEAQVDLSLTWSRLPDLPDAHGFAGAYAGVSHDALIVTGGANFPDGPPWRSGAKAWHDVAFVLPPGEAAWRTVQAVLPSPRGYGASITLPRGVVCIGGADAKRHYADAFTLEWDGSRLVRRNLPPLPAPLANFSAGAIGSAIYLVGGTESPTATVALQRVLTIDLAVSDPQWREVEPLPGPGRLLPVVATTGGALYVVSGASLAPDAAGKPARTYLTDAYRYTPGVGWKQITDVPQPVVAAPTPAPPCGDNGFAILGGDDGANVSFEPKDQHPGFSRDVLAYDSTRNTWRVVGELPLGQVTATVVPLGDGYIIPSGEIRPAVRTTVVSSLALPKREGR